MRVPIGMTSASKHPSQDANNRQCINLFPANTGPDADPNMVLLPTPGRKLLVEVSGGLSVRAIMRFDEKIYIVVDDKVYLLTIDEGTRTATAASIGSINSSSGRVSWARNPTQIMMVDGTADGYIITAATDTLVTISDPDFAGGETVVFMDGYFIYNEPNSARMHATAINDGTDMSALDVATAEGHPDNLVGLAVDKRELWAFGHDSVEVWYNAANPTGFPFSVRQGAFVDLGCKSKHSITSFNNTLVWLDSRNLVVAAESYTPQIISSAEIQAQIQAMEDPTDALYYEYESQGHIFYALTFPTDNITYVFDSITGLWHQVAEYTNDQGFQRSKIHVTQNYKQWTLAGSRNSGEVFILGAEYHDNAGTEIHRLFTTDHFENEYKFIAIDELELHMESGKAKVTGDGSDPMIQMRYSNDGGYSWSNSLARSMGKLGEYSKRIRWNRLGSAREWIFEFSISSNIKMAFINLAAKIGVSRDS